MKCYNIEAIEADKYIVFSTSYVSPLEFIKDIEIELSKLVNYKIEIIFDLLLSSGNSSKRFAKINYDGKHLDRKSFKFISIDKKDNLRKVSADHYKYKGELVEQSILSSIQKKLITNGIAI